MINKKINFTTIITFFLLCTRKGVNMTRPLKYMYYKVTKINILHTLTKMNRRY